MKNQINSLPEKQLRPNGKISKQCIDLGLSDFRLACRHVRDLPYGELDHQNNWINTLSEGKGTSCTKHAFLKILADENDIPIDLVLGVYAMTEQNTPGVGVILNKYRMQSIPEAHCYFLYEGQRVDLTRHYFDIDFIEPIKSFIYEEIIQPENAQDYKLAIHKRVICERFGESRFEHIWKIREHCIAALEN